MLTGTGRNLRALAATVVLLALFWGTLWGHDDHFPVGPFRMFSTTNQLDGVVRSARVAAVDAAGGVFDIPADHASFGLRRAEIEGQLPRFAADPSLLAHLAAAYGRLHPEAPPIVELSLYQSVVRLVGGEPQDELEAVEVSVWRAR